MLGYLLQEKELLATSKRIDMAVLKNASIQALSRRVPVPPNELLRGNQSFGHLMSRGHNDVRVIPSPDYPAPFTNSVYYRGGYTTQTYHTNASQDGLDVIQIELPRHMRFTNSEQELAAVAVSNATIHWLNAYYQPVELRRSSLL